MAQFDIYQNPNVPQRQIFPYVVQIQHDFYDALGSRLVVPLQRARIPAGAFPRRLTETIRVEGEDFHIAIHLAAGFPERLLRRPVASARDQQFVLRDAIDALIEGV